MNEVKDLLLKKASEYGLVPTEFFERVLKAKERFGLTEECPCDRNNKERYCISQLCLSDIERDGKCHCQMWRKNER